MRPQQIELIEPVAAVYADRIVTQSELDWLTVQLVSLGVMAVVTGALQGLLMSMVLKAL